jgi:MFS family permease
MVTLLAGAGVVGVIGASTLLTTAIAVVRPIHFAALPSLAGTPEVLVSANAVSSIFDGTFRFIGPVAAGLVVAHAGYWQAFALEATVSLGACLLCLRLGLPRPEGDGDEVGSIVAAVQGLVTLWRDWGALALLLVLTIDFVVTGALDVLGVSFTTDVLGRPETDAGYVIGALGVGSLIGAVLAASAGRRRRLAPVIVTGAVVEGLCFAAVALVAVLAPALLLLVLSGLGGAVMLVSGRTLLQRATDDRVLARVFAVQESTTLLGTALGALLAPVLIDLVSARYAFVPLGIACALLALSCVILVRRLDARAVLHPEELALLRGVPFLSVLPEYELERLAQRARWELAPAGTVVIRQGDDGDAFYVTAEGELRVDVDGFRADHVIMAGFGFGEIALLRSVVRTATITALTDARLLVIDSDDFLEAVTGSVNGHAIAAEASAAHLDRDRRRDGVDR